MKKLFPILWSVLLCMAGCTNEDVAEVPVAESSIQATFEKQASRLAVGEGNALTWSTGDAFKMFNGTGENSVWTLQGTGGSEDGLFTGEKLERIAGAAFPASDATSFTNGVLTMTLPATLTYKAGVCNLPMWASFNSLDAAISFKHLGALLKVDFTNMPAGYNKLVVTADRALAGTFTTSLSQTEPVLNPASEGTMNRIEISFDASASEEDKLFYIPLPVGVYGSINISISNGENTLSIADWRDRTIVRKKVYVASVAYRTSAAETPAQITEELEELTYVTLEITNKIKAEDGNIAIPAEATKIGLNFVEVPVTTVEKPLTIVETAATEGTELNISIPESTEDAYLTLDMPTTTVNVESGKYGKIIARTASQTLVIGEDTEVKDLVILAGNVVLNGGKVTGSITRDAANQDKVTYIYLNGESSLEGITVGEDIVEPDYLTFDAQSAQTLTLSKAVETLEYSVNGGVWTTLGTNTVTFGGEEMGNLRLRGKNPNGTSLSDNPTECGTVKFGDENVTVSCTGDIRTLVDYENYANDALDTSKARFTRLFYGCKVLTSAPKLPATVLAEKCYYYMFGDCTTLTTAPELPATTMANSCYERMFTNCTALTEAPALPATTLANRCYAGMFMNCTALVSAPKLPATTLASGCYNSMFSRCSALSSAPELPAVTMMESCYHGMFDSCAALTEAPELPATTLANGCYYLMFARCTGLTKAPELPATTLVNNCYYSMFMNCTALTEAPELPATTLADYCYYYMFNGCSGLTKASALPATTLANSCYYGMYQYCKSLTSAPKLPATTLANYCYAFMFDDCKMLTSAPELPATVLTEGCYRWMLAYSGITEAPALPATTLAKRCYDNMFQACANITKAPELPATTLADYCYNGMFFKCTSLTEAPELPATTLANYCYTTMFKECTALTKAPELPATTLANQCYGSMFYNCTNLSEATMLATNISANNSLTDWLTGTASTGTLYKNSDLTDVSALGAPEGWTVKDKE